MYFICYEHYIYLSQNTIKYKMINFISQFVVHLDTFYINDVQMTTSRVN